MIEITQADRDAAAQHIPAMGMANSVINGKSDNHTLVQAFAVHRAETEQKIIKWLRAYECSYYIPSYIQEPFDEAADAIEAGEHLK